MMKTLHKLLILGLFLCSAAMSAQGADCNAADPFCSDINNTLTFPNVTNVPSTGGIACLGSTPNPAWYFIDNNGNGMVDAGEQLLDVDFVAWGPFTSAMGECGNTSFDCFNAGGGVINCPNNTTDPNFYINDNDNSNIVDCSFSAQSQESLTITNADIVEFY